MDRRPGVFEPFEIEKYTFSQLFASDTFRVPQLQRPYAWRTEQALDLIDDIVALIEASEDQQRERRPQHFIGTIVTISNLARSQIIDGQQRITTATLLIALIRNALEDLKIKVENSGSPQTRGLIDRIERMSTRCWGFLYFDDDNPQPRLLPSPEIAQTYLSYLANGDGKVDAESSDAAKGLREVAKVLTSKLVQDPERFGKAEPAEKIDYLQLLFDSVTKNLMFVRVDTGSSTVGYTLFESLNATGKPLNALALLKVWMLAQLQGNEKADQIAKEYHELQIQKEELALSFVTDYFRARTFSNPGKITQKAFSLKVRGQVFLDPDVGNEYRHASADAQGIEDRIVNHVSTMSRWYPKWMLIREGKPPYEGAGVASWSFYAERLEFLLGSTLKHTLPVPLLLQAAEHLSPLEFMQLVNLIERTFFRFKTICKGSESKLERIYQDLARILDSQKRLDLAIAQQKLQVLIDDEANDRTFSLSLGEYEYRPNRSKIIVYFLSSLDHLSKSPPEKAVLDVKGRGFTVEHVAPQAGNGAVSDLYVHQIGNLCLLNKTENPQFGNRSFAEKKTLSRNGGLLSSRLSSKVFAENSSWTDREVEQRKQFLIEQALKVFTPSLLL